MAVRIRAVPHPMDRATFAGSYERSSPPVSFEWRVIYCCWHKHATRAIALRCPAVLEAKYRGL